MTLLVTNASCLLGRCDSLEVLGFPGNQLNTPGGPWSLELGIMRTPQACFTLPTSAQFRLIGVHNDGTADTVTITWTPDMTLFLGAQPPSWSRFQANPGTSGFVPASAAGWRITFPTDTSVTPSAPC